MIFFDIGKKKPYQTKNDVKILDPQHAGTLLKMSL